MPQRSIWGDELDQGRNYELPNGTELRDVKYQAYLSSDSTMVYTGLFIGNVSAQDIIKAIGEGSFGHRGPEMRGNRFTYTKVTD